MAQKRPDRTLAPGHDEFWAWCAKGELRLQRCAACGTLVWPAVPACAACGGDALVWKRMSGRGRVVGWCTFERDRYRGVLPILVELEEGPLFLSNPHGFTWTDIVPDMPVAPAFVACEDSPGPFALPVFARA